MSWDKNAAAELLKHDLNHNQIGAVIGLIAEHRQICYHEGYQKGFNDGSEYERQRANRAKSAQVSDQSPDINHYYIDIPTEATIDGGPEGAWTNVFIAESKTEAIEWIRSNIGWCDDDGKISLLTQMSSDDMKEF